MKKTIIIIISILVITNLTYSQDFNIGDQHTFWQFDVVKGTPDMEKGYYQSDFTCIREGKHTLVFLENEIKDSQLPTEDYINRLFKRFEQIFPILSEYFGPPSDLDENGKFIILMADIRDWFYHELPTTDDMASIQGYYWFPFNGMNNNDYLTMDTVQPLIDSYGTLAHEYFHNVYDHINPEPVNFTDRAVNEALAHYAIYLNGTIHKDSYVQWQFSILEKDLKEDKLLNPFTGEMNYFDIETPDLHHSYAAGYLFMYYVAEELIKDATRKRQFFNTLIYEEINGTSLQKIVNALWFAGIIEDEEDFHELYNKDFKEYLKDYFNI